MMYSITVDQTLRTIYHVRTDHELTHAEVKDIIERDVFSQEMDIVNFDHKSVDDKLINMQRIKS